MIKFSIIIPIYNAELYLDGCLQSIIAQTYNDYEVVLIDDGSVDTSLEKCNQWAKADSRVKVFHKENGGVSSARNFGLNLISNEWVCFVDADDELEPDYLENFSLGIQKYEADMYICGFKYVYHNTHILYEMQNSLVSKNEFLDLYLQLQPQGKFGIPWNKCFRKSIIDQNNLSFDVNVKRAEDELFNLIFMKYAQCVVTLSVNTYIYYRYDLPTGANKYQNIDERLYVSKLLMKYASELEHDDININLVYQLFANNMVLAIKELYWKHNYWHFSVYVRYKIFRKVRQMILDNVSVSFYHKALKCQYLFLDNFIIIELLGFLLYLRYKIL